MIDRSHDLSITSQAKALNISRSTVYYRPRAVPAADLAIMRRMDQLHLDFPFAGSRMLRDLVNAESVAIGRQHVATLMKRMGIAAIYRRPNTSKPAPGHKIYRTRPVKAVGWEDRATWRRRSIGLCQGSRADRGHGCRRPAPRPSRWREAGEEQRLQLVGGELGVRAEDVG